MYTRELTIYDMAIFFLNAPEHVADEIAKTTGDCFGHTLISAFDSACAVVTDDNVLVGILGGTAGNPWFEEVKELSKYRFTFYKKAMQFIRECVRKAGVVSNRVSKDNIVHIRFLHHLGARFVPCEDDHKFLVWVIEERAGIE